MKRNVYNLMTIIGVWAFLSSTSAYGQTFGEYKEAGDTYLRSGKSAFAIGEYKKALELNPGSTPVYFNLAIAHYSERNIPQTIKTLEKLASISPHDAEVQYNLGCLYIYIADLEKSKQCFEKARLCCAETPIFGELAQQSLLFVNQVEKLDPSRRQALLILFQKGLTPLAIGK